MRVLIAKFPEHNFDHEFTDKSSAQHRKATRSVAATERREVVNQLGGVGERCKAPPHTHTQWGPWTKLWKILSFSVL